MSLYEQIFGKAGSPNLPKQVRTHYESPQADGVMEEIADVKLGEGGTKTPSEEIKEFNENAVAMGAEGFEDIDDDKVEVMTDADIKDGGDDEFDPYDIETVEEQQTDTVVNGEEVGQPDLEEIDDDKVEILKAEDISTNDEN